MSIFDIVVIALIGLSALLGLWKGFFKTLIGFFGWTVSFLLAFFLTRTVASALLDVASIREFVLGTGEKWSLFRWISGKLPAEALTAESGFLGLLISPLRKIVESTEGVDVVRGVPLLLANGIFNVIVCLGLFLLIRLLMLFFTLFANAMTKGKFVGGLNRLLGFLFGAVRGTAFVCIIMVFMSFLMGLSFMTPVRNQLESSVISKPIYNQVVKFTDKHLGGNSDTLKKLWRHFDVDHTPAYVGTYEGTELGEIPVFGTYTYTNDGGVTYTLTLKREDAIYSLSHKGAHDESATVDETGAYAAADGKVTLTPATSGGEGGETPSEPAASKEATLSAQGKLTLDGHEYARDNSDVITTTYTLELKKDGAYTMTIAVSINPDGASVTEGTYQYDGENKKLTLFSGGETDELPITDDGAFVFDDVTLQKK